MKRIVVAFGHRYRGDDAVGPLVVEQLDNEATFIAEGDALAVLSAWLGYDHVVMVDAMRSGRPPGTIERIDATNEVPARTYTSSTHSFGPIELIRLAKALGLVPAKVDLIGIEAGSLRLGTALTSEVARAADFVVEELRDA